MASPSYDDLVRLAALARRFASTRSLRDDDALRREARKVAWRSGWVLLDRPDLLAIAHKDTEQVGVGPLRSPEEVLMIDTRAGEATWETVAPPEGTGRLRDELDAGQADDEDLRRQM
jgi:hypothetical protein